MRKLILCFIIGLIANISCATDIPSQIHKKKFRFIVNADPQMGARDTNNQSLKVRNELLENFVAEVNLENKKSPVEFVIYNGDLVNNSLQASFDNFTRIVSKQEIPSFLVHGNHDGNENDPKFFEAQEKLSNFKKLNYSFEYGNWVFIIIGAQQKYSSEEKKTEQLEWLSSELNRFKDKQVILFMHYHIMPIGLSQMEYYTYWPIKFKNRILEIITKLNNVKYVFSGHVHTGVQASIKSSLDYKGVKFINCPTPALARPFGEEFIEYENIKDEFYHKGYYLEVNIDGNNVELIGRKIHHEFKVVYPDVFNEFNEKSDIRFFKPEKDLEPRKFSGNFHKWSKSYRYKKEKDNSFINKIDDKRNILELNSPWGGWSSDEYMESYQIIEIDSSEPNIISYDFNKPEFSNQGGGYIKFIFFDETSNNSILLFHWGSNEHIVKTMYKSWFNHIDGERPRKIVKKINNKLLSKKMLSFALTFNDDGNQLLQINLNKLITLFNMIKVKKISISHGVWTKVSNIDGVNNSKLIVNETKINHTDKGLKFIITMNDHVIDIKDSDKASPYLGHRKK